MDEKDFSGCIFSSLETCYSVVGEKCGGETVYLLQQFASAITLQPRWRAARINSFLC